MKSGRIRSAALLAIGALALHQLRYALAYGSASSQALAEQGHGYLTALAEALLPLALAALAAALLAPWLDGAEPGAVRRHPLPVRSLLFAVSLASLFGAQELLEGALASGHPAGIAALLADRGWLAAPLALGLGFACALVAAFLDRVPAHLRGRAVSRRRILPRPGLFIRLPRTLTLAAPRPLAFGLARRGPPPLPSAR